MPIRKKLQKMIGPALYDIGANPSIAEHIGPPLQVSKKAIKATSAVPSSKWYFGSQNDAGHMNTGKIFQRTGAPEEKVTHRAPMLNLAENDSHVKRHPAKSVLNDRKPLA
jgi:hypothetical protein